MLNRWVACPALELHRDPTVSAWVLDASRDSFLMPPVTAGTAIVADWDHFFGSVCATAAATQNSHHVVLCLRPACILQHAMDLIRGHVRWWWWLWWRWWSRHEKEKKKSMTHSYDVQLAPISAIRVKAAPKSRTETLEASAAALALPYCVSVVWLINVFFDF